MNLTVRLKNCQEVNELIENGLEYFCAIEDTKLFRKWKWR
jgi:hypothetical protein